MATITGSRPLGTIFIICLVYIMICFSPGYAREKKRIVLLETMPVPVVLEHSRWFLDELAALGWIQGKTMALVRFNAEGDREKARGFLRRLLEGSPPDLVVTNATLASQEALAFLKRSNIPQLFFTVADPVGSGLIQKEGRPTGGHLTGRIFSLDHKAKIKNTLRLVEQIPVKKPIRFGIIHTTYPSSVGEVRKLTRLARSNPDIQFITQEIQYKKVPEGVPDMLESVRTGIKALEKKIDFWWEVPGPLGELFEFDDLFHRLSSHPVVFGNTLESVRNQGTLLYMSPDAEKYGRETARVAHAILTGTDPGTIPVRPPADFLLAINLKTALKLNIVIPSDMFELAGPHIY